MTKIKSWIAAIRLRTLPLAIASILMGSFLAINSKEYSWTVITLAIVTTLFLQILSNLANDFGDGMKGTDNSQRVGPLRTIQSGKIEPKEMRVGILIFVLLSLISGVWLIFESLSSNLYMSIIFFVLGILAIAAAIKYTVGKKAFGYSGMGDIFVFLFFGLLAVLGTYFLNTHKLYWEILLPALSMGFLSTGVLNLNNMRDMENDAISGKKTMALILGFKNAKIYQNIIIYLAMIGAIVFIALQYRSLWQFVFIISYPLIIKELYEINKITDKSLLDPYLKKSALSTLLFTILFGVGLIFG